MSGQIKQGERNAIIKAAIEAISEGGRTYPNRLRCLTTHYAIQMAIDAADGISQADGAAEDQGVLEEALRKREKDE